MPHCRSATQVEKKVRPVTSLSISALRATLADRDPYLSSPRARLEASALSRLSILTPIRGQKKSSNNDDAAQLNVLRPHRNFDDVRSSQLATQPPLNRQTPEKNVAEHFAASLPFIRADQCMPCAPPYLDFELSLLRFQQIANEINAVARSGSTRSREPSSWTICLC